jgi:hypothetical protein
MKNGLGCLKNLYENVFTLQEEHPELVGITRKSYPNVTLAFALQNRIIQP